MYSLNCGGSTKVCARNCSHGNDINGFLTLWGNVCMTIFLLHLNYYTHCHGNAVKGFFSLKGLKGLHFLTIKQLPHTFY